MQRLSVVYLIRGAIGWDYSPVWTHYGFLLKGARVSRDDQVLEGGQLGNGVEQLFLVVHLIEGKVELLKIGEGLFLDWQLGVVLGQISTVELNKLVP